MLLTANLAVVLGVVAVASFLKRVFIDYLADIALYTTADENSAFFATRTAILREATRRIRVLLRDSKYEAVALAGHSLGSVIGYEAINWLRTEAMLPQTASVLEILGQLENLSKGLAPEDAAKAAALVDQVKRAASAGEFWEAAGDSTAGVRPLSRASRTPITADELSKPTTFITFGSPLNKGDITRILSWERPACLSCDRID